MLKLILLALTFCISIQCFCATSTPINTSLSAIYAQNSLTNKHQNGFEKQAFFKNKWAIHKRFPFFGVGSIISFLIAILSIEIAASSKTSNTDWLAALPFILLLLSLISSIVGLVIGEFWVWSVLGLLLNIFALAFLYLIARAGRQC